MNINFLDQLYKEIKKVKKYEEPFIIMLSGLPGSGKTYLSQELSRKLKIYLLSTDYVRNYYYQSITEYTEDNRLSIEEKVKEINEEKLNTLVDNNISFVLDRWQTDLGIYEQHKFDKYKKILIKIVSQDDITNIKRIQNRKKIDFTKEDDTIIGDNVMYSSPYPAEVYYEIKNRKIVNIPEESYDFIIENQGSIEEYNVNIENLIEQIKNLLEI